MTVPLKVMAGVDVEAFFLVAGGIMLAAISGQLIRIARPPQEKEPETEFVPEEEIVVMPPIQTRKPPVVDIRENKVYYRIPLTEVLMK